MHVLIKKNNKTINFYKLNIFILAIFFDSDGDDDVIFRIFNECFDSSPVSQRHETSILKKIDEELSEL